MISINGKTYHGKSVSVVNGEVFVDGKKSTDSKTLPIININIIGDINSISVDVCDTISVVGNVGNIETTNGDVTIEGNVLSNIKTTNGDVKCGDVGGKIKTTNGDIIKNKKKF